MTADATPMVGIVVVNYFGGDMTMRCLESLQRLTWPADRLAVALVDNGSEPGFVQDVRRRFPAVRLVETGANLGFGGACNRGFDALEDCAYLALLNNDAIPEPGWLEPLVEVLEAHPTVGAATPTVLLSGSYLQVRLDCATRSAPGDHRDLGVQVTFVRVDDRDVSCEVLFAAGMWGWESTVDGSFVWTNGRGIIEAPAPAQRPVAVEIGLRAALGPAQVSLTVGGKSSTVTVPPEGTSLRLDAIAGARRLTNNTGLVVSRPGVAADRDYLTPQEVSTLRPGDVGAWSGAAVLLSRRFLDDVGGFDASYFLYYEDVDLAWRGRLRGWTYRFAPASVVGHDSGATTSQFASLVRHLAARNRLLTTIRCAPRPWVVDATRRLLAELAATFVRDVVLQVVRRQPVRTSHVRERVLVLVGVARRLPGAVATRRRLGKVARTRRADVGRRLDEDARIPATAASST